MLFNVRWHTFDYDGNWEVSNSGLPTAVQLLSKLEEIDYLILGTFSFGRWSLEEMCKNHTSRLLI